MPSDQVQNALLSQGVLGIVVILCIGAIIALWYEIKNVRKEHIAAQTSYIERQADQSEKYRLALQQFNQVLDSVVRMHRGTGGPQ